MFLQIVLMTYVSGRDSSTSNAGSRWSTHQKYCSGWLLTIDDASEAAGCRVNSTEHSESRGFILTWPLVSEVL